MSSLNELGIIPECDIARADELDPNRRDEMSDTPRTDAVAAGLENLGTGGRALYQRRLWSLAYTLERELTSARAERDAFRADAERYRWLREQYWIEGEGRERLGLMPATANHAADVAEFDAAIDAKLKETK